MTLKDSFESFAGIDILVRNARLGEITHLFFCWVFQRLFHDILSCFDFISAYFDLNIFRDFHFYCTFYDIWNFSQPRYQALLQGEYSITTPHLCIVFDETSKNLYIDLFLIKLNRLLI